MFPLLGTPFATNFFSSFVPQFRHHFLWGSLEGKYSVFPNLILTVLLISHVWVFHTEQFSDISWMFYNSILTQTAVSTDPKGEGLSTTRLPFPPQVSVKSPGCHLCFSVTACKLEVTMTLSLSMIIYWNSS